MKWRFGNALCLFAAIIALLLWLELGTGTQIPGGLKLCAVLLGVIGIITSDDEW